METRLAPRLHIFGCVISFTFVILSIVLGNVQLLLLGFILSVLTWLTFGLRELLIFLAIVNHQPRERGVLIYVGLRASALIDIALVNANMLGAYNNIPPFSILRYDPIWYTIGLIFPIILLLGIAIIWLFADQKFSLTLPIGRGFVSQWPFKSN